MNQARGVATHSNMVFSSYVYCLSRTIASYPPHSPPSTYSLTCIERNASELYTVYMKTKPCFVINHGTYPFDVLVCIGKTDEEVYKELEKFGHELSDEDKEYLKCNGDGRTVMLDGGQTVLRVKIYKDKAKMAGFIAHEVFHAVEFLFDRIKIKHDVEISSEAFAYQIGHLTKQIYEKLK